MVEKVDDRRRCQHERKPARIRSQRLQQVPRPVVEERCDDVPRDCHRGSDAPIDEERVRASARAGYRQCDIYAGDTVDDQVRRGLHHMLSSESSARSSA